MAELVLGIETSCDETSAAVLSVQDGRALLRSLVILSQDVHRIFGGVVPELASRAHLRTIGPVVDQALREAGAAREELTGIAATAGPGLIGPLLVGFTYGKVEARMKLPAGAGIWPAFWALGTDIATNPWPACGEIDVMEFIGKTPNLTYGTLHGPGYSAAKGIGKSFDFGRPVADDFHTYTIIKRPNEIVWYVDGVEYHRLSPDKLPAGGSWAFDAGSARCALRYTHRPQDRGYSLGFRVAADAR